MGWFGIYMRNLSDKTYSIDVIACGYVDNEQAQSQYDSLKNRDNESI